MAGDKKLRRATAGPVAKSAVKGPGRPRLTKKGELYRVDVFPGTHTAVSLANVGSAKINSNNPNVTDSTDTLTWLDPNPTAAERTIHFHVKATQSDKEDTTLFELKGSTGRAVFQVRRVPFPPMDRVKKGRLFLELNGLSVALNQNDGKIDPYDLAENITVPNSMSHVAALDEALKRANGRKIDHLVVNAHGRNVGGRAEIELGDHFHPGNLDSWNRLKDKVGYIWLQGCVIGFDTQFLNDIADRTGAWVAAPADVEIETLPARKLKIDYVPKIYKYFNTRVPREPGESSSSIPRSLPAFHRNARTAANPNLTADVAFLLASPDK